MFAPIGRASCLEMTELRLNHSVPKMFPKKYPPICVKFYFTLIYFHFKISNGLLAFFRITKIRVGVNISFKNYNIFFVCEFKNFREKLF
jgi:hypothetical protein